eukprot:TRINITY_DN2143_c0_g1_i1.p2 TRINITY_DN2143_c0_g1~~TRINITY_DN2143_c0_g1_i1.p2  ORF type:complete len:130 (-),score=41.62 TRINITY_DN2143_c0_g1_i1:634-984(-)
MVALWPAWAFWLSTSPVLIARAVSGAMCFTSSSIMILNSTVVDVGRVNGVTAIIGGIAKAIGPLVVTNLFAFTASSELPFPFNQYFTFFVVAAISLCLFCLSWTLPARVGFKAVNE